MILWWSSFSFLMSVTRLLVSWTEYGRTSAAWITSLFAMSGCVSTDAIERRKVCSALRPKVALVKGFSQTRPWRWKT